MNPRFAPVSEYLPGGTLWKANLPSSVVTSDSNFRESAVFLRVTRARPRGWPSLLLTTVPATPKPSAGIAGGTAAVCAAVYACAASRQRIVRSKDERAELEEVAIIHSLLKMIGTCTVVFWPGDK